MRLLKIIGIRTSTLIESFLLLCLAAESLSRVLKSESLTNESETIIARVIFQQLEEQVKQLTLQNKSNDHQQERYSLRHGLSLQGNLRRAFFSASLAFICFGTCCAVQKFRWKERKRGCPRDLTQIQFLEEELEDRLSNNGEENKRQLNQSEERQNLQGAEQSRKNLIYDFPFFEADVLDETSKEVPLREMEVENTSLVYNTTVHITHII